jgi:hypothetical protein
MDELDSFVRPLARQCPNELDGRRMLKRGKSWQSKWIQVIIGAIGKGRQVIYSQVIYSPVTPVT